MATASYADPGRCVGISVPKVWNGSPTPSRFGDVVLVLFLLAQCFDGVFTYVGVLMFGIQAEANPLIAAMMVEFGAGAALIGAKSVAGILGIVLHLREVHGAVAGLTLFYVTIAVAPWTAILVMH